VVPSGQSHAELTGRSRELTMSPVFPAAARNQRNEDVRLVAQHHADDTSAARCPWAEERVAPLLRNTQKMRRIKGRTSERPWQPDYGKFR